MTGKLIWLMGASGSGKDSLLTELRQREQTQLLVAHRYITRAASAGSAGSENHIALSEQEFFTRAVAEPSGLKLARQRPVLWHRRRD